MHVLFRVAALRPWIAAAAPAISATTQLEELVSLGWTCRTVTGTVTTGHEPFENIGITLHGGSSGLAMPANRSCWARITVGWSTSSSRCVIHAGPTLPAATNSAFFEVVREQPAQSPTRPALYLRKEAAGAGDLA